MKKSGVTTMMCEQTKITKIFMIYFSVREHTHTQIVWQRDTRKYFFLQIRNIERLETTSNLFYSQYLFLSE